GLVERFAQLHRLIEDVLDLLPRRFACLRFHAARREELATLVAALAIALVHTDDVVGDPFAERFAYGGVREAIALSRSKHDEREHQSDDDERTRDAEGHRPERTLLLRVGDLR